MKFSSLIRTLSLALIAVFAGGVSAAVMAQIAGSPYSSIGLGLLNPREINYNSNMGGLGLTTGNVWALNYVNPALLPINSFTNFEAALVGESRVATSDGESIRGTSGSLGYLVFGFPLSPGKWTLSFGLMPYSAVNYRVESKAMLAEQNTEITYTYTGEGGINQANLSTGVKIGKHLFVGFRGIYLFGAIEKESFADLRDTTRTGASKSFWPTAYYQRTRLSDLTGQFGLMYSIPLSETSAFNIGTTYELGVDARTYRDERLENRRLQDFPITSDTISDNVSTRTFIPGRFGAGFSFAKSYKWTLGAEVYHQDWSAFRNYRGQNEGMAGSTRFILGGDLTPDYTSVSNYLKRINYGMGIYHETTPLVVNNRQIKDFGINFGVSLPVGSASLATIGMSYGQMGSVEGGSIREQYFKLRFSVSFNDRSYGWYRNQQKFN
jgi:hypothetical protein